MRISYPPVIQLESPPVATRFGGVETQTLIRLVVGLAMTAIVGVLALKRVGYLTKLISSGQLTADEGSQEPPR